MFRNLKNIHEFENMLVNFDIIAKFKNVRDF